MSARDSYGASAGYHAPPGQGYNDPQYQGYDDGPPAPRHSSYDPHSGHPIPPGYVPPHEPPPSSYDPQNFPPPPRSEYRDDYSQAPPRSEYDRDYDRGPPSDHGQRYNNRPYAPTEPEGNEGNQMTPYDDERAEAEWRRGYEEQQQQRNNRPPPPSDYDRSERRYDDRPDERDRRDDDRYYDYRPRRDDRDNRSYYDDRDSYGSRDRRYSDRRHEKPQSPKSPKASGKDVFGGREGERGLGAQILGGAAGGLAGHKFGKGNILETLGGVVVGAVGAKVLENQLEERKSKKENDIKNTAPHKDEAVYGSGRYASSYGGSRAPTRDDRSRRGGSRRRRGSDSDDYSSDEYDSRPPPRRRN